MLGRDLAGVDWEATPLGRPAAWPQSLHTTVRTMLGSRFAMWMAWGPDLTFFCNDAYRRATLGSKYPWALGRPAREVWAEIWPEIGPRIDKVIRTGAATWDEGLRLYLERSAYVEETYHTFSYSPLADDGGGVTGMLCVVSEDTDRVISTRRMATLRDLGAAVSALLTPSEVYAAACDQLGRNRADFPFALFYVAAEKEKETPPEAHLACAVGLEAEHPAAPSRLLISGDSSWPLPTEGPAGVQLSGRFEDLPWGDQPGPPAQALVLPLLVQPGAAPHAWLIAGLNRFRALDDGYRGFLDLIASQVAAAVAAASAYEHERHRAEQLAELDRAKTAFFTNVSHELRTPLTLMLGPIADALADRDRPLGERQRARLEVAQRSAQRLLGLVNTLLDFSRLEAGRVAPSLEPVDLGRHTAELAAMFEAVAAHSGLTLRVDVPARSAPVRMDRDLWTKIVLNLLSNAVKFTFTGGIWVELRLPEADAEGGFAELTVRDTGIGIAPAEQEYLFERFHRVEGARSRTHEGSGIGLALVAELAQLLGGEAAVESAAGVGSAFTVRVPVEYVPDADPLTPDRSPEVRRYVDEAAQWVTAGTAVGCSDGASAEDGRPYVLVVEDNADMRSYVGSLLAGSYRVELAVDGADALRRVAQRLPDLVLTDVMMPNVDGFALLTALRNSPRTAALPVIMLSARAGEDGVYSGLEAGADDYVTKPFSARELLARVRVNLEVDRAKRARAELETSRVLLDETQRLARVASWEVDVVTGRVATSPEFARMLKLTPSQVAELDVKKVRTELLHPQDRERVTEALTVGLDGTPIVFDAVFRAADGSEVLMEVVGEALRDAQGNAVTVRGSIQDVGEQRRAARQAIVDVTTREVAVREHQIAEELQASLLPGLDFDPDHLEVASFYEAGVEGTQVGGDWYDVIELGAGRTALVIGDVMGRGVRAAAVMGQLRAAIRAYARLDLAPADLLELCDGAVRDLGDDQIVTSVYAVFDPVEQSLTFANAGHLPPLLVGADGTVQRLSDTVGAPLGSGPSVITEATVPMALGSTLTLYTDGLVERRDRDIDTGIALLAEEIRGAAGPLASLPAQLVRRLLPDGQDDDVALLLARIPTVAPALPSVRFVVGDTPGTVATARHWVRRIVTGWELVPERCDDAELVVGELVTNALLHGAAPVEVRLRHSRDSLLIEVSDTAVFLPRRLRPDLEDEHGRGLLLVTQVAARWGVRPTPAGKAVWCVLATSQVGRASG
jgi:PAS domain S-box-containing protein